MPRYHIGKSGKPEECHANEKPCPLGKYDDHIEANTPEEANERFQYIMERQEQLRAQSKANQSNQNSYVGGFNSKQRIHQPNTYYSGQR